MQLDEISPAWIYANQHTGSLLPRPDGSFASERDRAQWNEAGDRYVKLHQPGERVDHDAETSKLQNMLFTLTLGMVADDPQIWEYLQYWADDLTDTLQSDPAIESAASEFARAWAGADLSDRVRKAANLPQDG